MPQSSSKSAILFSICMAHFLNPFMMSAVGVALPVMGREFNASALQLGLVETVFMLSMVTFLLAVGRFGDLHGRKRIFQIGLLVFGCAGGLISLTSSIEMIITLRFFQGVGGAMVNATTMAILVAAFPVEERGKALGIAIASVYAGISCGPFIGGYLIELLGWRSIFFLMFPFGLTTWLVTRIKIKEEWADAQGEPFDWLGLSIYAPSILLLVFSVTNLKGGGWMWGLLFLANLGLALFLLVESRSSHPMLDVRLLLENRVFALSNLAALFNYAATFGVTFFLSLYLQYVKGMGPHQAGTILIVQPIVQTIFSPLCGRLSDRMSASILATLGMASCAAGLGVAAFLQADSSIIQIFFLMIFLGFGFALFSSPNVSMIMGSVEPRHLGIASGLSASMRSMGMLTSMTIITLIFAWLMNGQAVTQETQIAFLSSMRISLLIFCALCVIGIGCSLGRIKSRNR